MFQQLLATATRPALHALGVWRAAGEAHSFMVALRDRAAAIAIESMWFPCAHAPNVLSHGLGDRSAHQGLSVAIRCQRH
jgi:hypothetical protein